MEFKLVESDFTVTQAKRELTLKKRPDIDICDDTVKFGHLTFQGKVEVYKESEESETLTLDRETIKESLEDMSKS